MDQEKMMDEKPTCKLSGEDGNTFSIIASVSKTLKRAGLRDKAAEFKAKALKAGSYDGVLQLCMEYVKVE